ncbi:MAG: DNA-binding response regulator [Pelagibacteraceae bacterium TMED267]|nr:MAG: DNA-binding response regulator [Pelagibacteraceae bacterium TMED267]
MSSKNLFIYNSTKLFEILNEIKMHLNFEVSYIDKKDYQKIDFKDFKNYLVITTDSCEKINNCLMIDKLPEKITKLIEKINLNFLRNQFNNQSEIKVGKYLLDLNSRKINLGKIYLDLTEKECDLMLFIQTNKKVNLKTLQKNVWGYSSDLETHTVETHIYRLRKKMLETFKDDNFIKYDKKGYFLN